MNEPIIQGQFEVKIIPNALGNHQIDFRIKNQKLIHLSISSDQIIVIQNPSQTNQA